MGSRNLEAVKAIWAALERDGLEASAEATLNLCHEDVEFTPYSGEGRTLRGADEVRKFLCEGASAGTTFHASAWRFEEEGDVVTVLGSIRVHRADGSLADAQVRWVYRFSGGLVKSASFEPLMAPV
jgi:hypothetical protein